VNLSDPRGTYSLSEHVQVMGGWGNLAQQGAWNFGIGCMSGFANTLMKNTLMGAETSKAEAATQCIVGGAMAASSFLASGFVGKSLAVSKFGKQVFGRMGVHHAVPREILAGFASGCLLSLPQGLASENAAGSILGSEPSGFAVFGTVASGCAAGALSTRSDHPVAAAIIGQWPVRVSSSSSQRSTPDGRMRAPSSILLNHCRNLCREELIFGSFGVRWCGQAPTDRRSWHGCSQRLRAADRERFPRCDDGRDRH